MVNGAGNLVKAPFDEAMNAINDLATIDIDAKKFLKEAFKHHVPEAKLDKLRVEYVQKQFEEAKQQTTTKPPPK